MKAVILIKTHPEKFRTMTCQKIHLFPHPSKHNAPFTLEVNWSRDLILLSVALFMIYLVLFFVFFI